MTKHTTLPTESGNYFTNKGWAYFDLKDGVFTQGGEDVEIEYYQDEADEAY